MTDKEMEDRFVGTLLGLAVGDALGAPVEFMTAEQIQKNHGTLKEMMGGGWLKLKPGEYTDDTTMMLCIAESLVENKGYNPDDIAERFVKWYRSGPKDIGKTTRNALKKIANGLPWKEAGNREGIANGSVMRCAPIGLMFAFDDRKKLIEVSVETSAITHAHKDATTSCVLINAMIAHLIQTNRKVSAIPAGLSAAIENDKLFVLKFSDRIMTGDPASGLAIDTISLAYASFIMAKNFEDAVVKAVNLGGDTDTIGAVTGALAGAYWGASAIPERWSSKINPYSAKKISEIGKVLFKLAKNQG